MPQARAVALGPPNSSKASSFLMPLVQHSVPDKSSMLFLTSSNLDYMDQLLTFGDRLRYARELRGLTQAALAKLVVQQGGRLTKSSVSQIEDGTTKMADALNSLYLSRALRIRNEWLTAREMPMEEAKRPPSTTTDGGKKPKRAA